MVGSTIDKLEIKKTDKNLFNNFELKTYRLLAESNDKNVKIIDDKQKQKDFKTHRKIDPNLIKFDHMITDFEIKLKYINLKDTDGKEYGKLFPPIKSQLVIIDDLGRKYSMTKAGVNQISGNLLSLINANNLKAGDVITIIYNRDSNLSYGDYLIHMKIKK